MRNNFETDEVITNAIAESYDGPTTVTIMDASGKVVTVNLSELKPGTEIFVDGRLLTKFDEDEWHYSLGLNAPTLLLDCEVANIVNQLNTKSELSFIP